MHAPGSLGLVQPTAQAGWQPAVLHAPFSWPGLGTRGQLSTLDHDSSEKAGGGGNPGVASFIAEFKY